MLAAACQSCSPGVPVMLPGVCQSRTMPVMLACMPVMLTSRWSMLGMLKACLKHDHAHEYDTSMIMPLDLDRTSSRDHSHGCRQAIPHSRGQHRLADLQRTTRRPSSRCRCLRRDRRGQHARSRRSLRSRWPSGAFHKPPRTPFPSICAKVLRHAFSLQEASSSAARTKNRPRPYQAFRRCVGTIERV